MQDDKPKKRGRHLSVPTFTDSDIEKVNAGLKSNVPEVRAETIVSLLGRVLPKLPDKYKYDLKSREDWITSNNFVYEIIGGINRHAAWADDNPGEFYRHLASIHSAPNIGTQVNTKGNITVVSGIPDSPLDNEQEIIDVDSKDIDE